jgi:hypothetical protein
MLITWERMAGQDFCWCWTLHYTVLKLWNLPDGFDCQGKCKLHTHQEKLSSPVQSLKTAIGTLLLLFSSRFRPRFFYVGCAG